MCAQARPELGPVHVSTSLFRIYEQRRHWRDCELAQARLGLRCTHMRCVPSSDELAQLLALVCHGLELAFKPEGVNINYI